MTVRQILPKTLESPRSVRLVLAVLIFTQVVLHLPFLNKPPMSQHVWRQVVGHAMAVNYYEEDSSFWSPRNDIRITDQHDGRIWHEFPLAYWLIGQSYNFTGYSDINARLIWFLMSLFAIPVAYFFLRHLGSSRSLALLFSYCFTFVPYYYYYSITLVPNLHALIWFMAGISLIAKPILEQRLTAGFLIGTACVAIGTLTKATYLFFGLPILYLFITSWLSRRGRMPIVLAVVVGLVVGVSNLLVNIHAKTLYDAAPVEQSVHTPLGPAELPENLSDIWDNLSTALTSSFGEMFLGFAALPLFLAGLYLLAKRKIRLPQPYFWLLWITSFAIFACFFIVRFDDHDYYITSTLPIAAVITAVSAQKLLETASTRKVAIALLCLMPFVMVLRNHLRWSVNTQVPEELLSGDIDLTSIIGKDERILILGDNTPIVFLYFLKRKGLAESTTVTPARLKELFQAGINWVVSYSPRSDLSELQNYLEEKRQYGNFTVYAINMHTP